jgi:hypothetical protein
MILEDVLDYFEELNSSEDFGFEHFYIGKLESKKNYSLGIYNLKHGNVKDQFCIGQLRNYKVLNVSLLLHISKKFKETEAISNKLFDYLVNLIYSDSFKIKDYDVYLINLLSGNEDVGQDKEGIYERVINIQIYYK